MKKLFDTYIKNNLGLINLFGKAIGSLEKCNQLDSENVAVDFELSKNYLLLKKYFEAEIFIDKALEKEPNNKYLILHKNHNKYNDIKFFTSIV